MIRPLAANYAYSAFTALATLLLVPLYVHRLGGGWGELALCLTLQGLLFLADGALSPLLLRDAARATRATAWPVYRHFLRWYVAVAAVLFLAGQAALSAFGPHDAVLLPALRIALVQFAFQFVNGAAIAFLIGRGHQREANLRLIAFAAAKHATALLLLVRTPTATAFLGAFALVSAIEFASNGLRLRQQRDVASVEDGRDAPPLLDDGRRTVLFVAASVLGLVAGQTDRIYLALTQPADRYGIYYLAGSVLLSLLGLQVPAMRSFLPALSIAERPRAVAASMLGVLAVTIIVPALVTMLFAQPLLALWLHDAVLAGEAAPILRLLMPALVMNALYAPAGLLLLRAHRYVTLTAMNATILIAQLLVLYLLTPSAGILAGAFAWLTCGVVQLAVAIAVWRGAIATGTPGPMH